MPRQTSSMDIELAIEIWQSHYHRHESDYSIAARLGIGKTAGEMTIIGRKYSVSDQSTARPPSLIA